MFILEYFCTQSYLNIKKQILINSLHFRTRFKHQANGRIKYLRNIWGNPDWLPLWGVIKLATVSDEFWTVCYFFLLFLTEYSCNRVLSLNQSWRRQRQPTHAIPATQFSKSSEQSERRPATWHKRQAPTATGAPERGQQLLQQQGQ